MENISGIFTVILIAVFVVVGVALVFLLLELTKFVKTTNNTVAGMKEKLDPVLDNVQEMTDSIKPAVAKIDPMVDRLQLTLDAVNLEMMRVDEILEDVSQITDSASSATAAVDNITNAPAKAVASVATRVRSALGVKSASSVSTELGEKKEAVAKALEDFKAAEAKGADAKAEKAAEATQADSTPSEKPATPSEEAADAAGSAKAEAVNAD